VEAGFPASSAERLRHKIRLDFAQNNFKPALQSVGENNAVLGRICTMF
jgi:hypothetical protein